MPQNFSIGKRAEDKRSQEKWNHGESSSEDSKMSSGANEDLNQKDSDEYLDMCFMCILREIVDRGPDVECKLEALVDLLKFKKRYILNRIKAYNEAIGKRREKYRDLFTRQQKQHDEDQNESSSEDQEEETDELTAYGSGDDDEGRRSKKTSGKKNCWKRLWKKVRGKGNKKKSDTPNDLEMPKETKSKTASNKDKGKRNKKKGRTFKVNKSVHAKEKKIFPCKDYYVKVDYDLDGKVTGDAKVTLVR